MNRKIYIRATEHLPCLLIFILLFGPFFKSSYINAQQGHYADFPSFYFAAENIFEKDKSPYDLSLMKENEKEIGQKILPYLYPPPTVFLFRPLLLFDYQVARNYALTSNILIFAGIVILLTLSIKLENISATQTFQIFLVVFLLSFRPIQLDFQHIQVNTILLFLFTVIWLSMRMNRMVQIVVPVALTLAIFLKTYPVLFLLMLFLFKRYKLVGVTILLCILVVATSLIFLPFEYWIEWFADVIPTGGYGRGVYANEPLTAIYNVSLNGLIYRTFSDTEFSEALVLIPITVKILPYIIFVFIFFLIIRYRSKVFSVNTLDREFSIYLLVIFLLAPISWEDHLTFLIPVFVVFIMNIFEKRFNVSILEAILSFGLILLSWRLFYNVEYIGNPILNLGLSLKTFILILFLVYFIFYYPDKTERSNRIRVDS